MNKKALVGVTIANSLTEFDAVILKHLPVRTPMASKIFAVNFIKYANDSKRVVRDEGEAFFFADLSVKFPCNFEGFLLKCSLCSE